MTIYPDRQLIRAARLLSLAAIVTLSAGASVAAEYNVPFLAENIASTAATASAGHIEVFGTPRMSESHPCTLWDKQDVEELKLLVKTNKEAAEAFETLRSKCDRRIAEPLNVPVPRKGPDGKWMFPGDFPENESPFKKVGRTNESNAQEMAALGMMYSLTGDPKYAEYCKKMLLAYADSYPKYGHPADWTDKKYRSATDGRLTHQFLDDGFWLMDAAFAYDLVYSLPSWTADERNKVRDDLFRAVVAEFIAPVIGTPDYLSMPHNRSVICAAATLIAGYATENQEMINNATYGTGGTKEKMVGGLVGLHFSPQCILPDGLWLEGAPAYQVGIAACGLFNAAEVLWRHGIDIYRAQNGVLKRLLDSALALAYPDPQMTVASLHDSSRMAMIDERPWFNHEAGIPYELGYSRYRDPRYIPIIRNATKALAMTVHSGAPSQFLELPPDEKLPPRLVENANFYSTGYGVLRIGEGEDANQLILEYGPSAGHAHPSKLAIDLYALRDALIPFPGVIFPYNDPMDPKWYWTTLGNCALTVDEKPQIYSGNRYKFPKNLPAPDAQQLIYGPASTIGIERAWSKTVYPGVTQDRALFLTANYLADLFAGLGDAPHKYDMAWHFRGQIASDLKSEPMTFPEPVADGYNALTDVTHASTNQAWTATVTTPSGKPVRLLVPGGTPTEVIFGKGHFFTKSSKEDEFPPTVIERRADVDSALYGNVVDISGDEKGHVMSVSQQGSIKDGYGLLEIGTVKGTDLCFASYRPGTHKAGKLESDAQQAFVSMDGPIVQAMYLGGGTVLKSANATLQRNKPGLAYVEKTKSGSYLVGNPSPVDATITVTLPALAGLQACLVDEQGKRIGPATVTNGQQAGSMSLALKANSKAEFSAGDK
ncbi:MAG: heparinase II/III family protein [Verrucomicrobiota bacterium]